MDSIFKNKPVMYSIGGLFFLLFLYMIFRDEADSAFFTATGIDHDTDPDKMDRDKVLSRANTSRGAEVSELQRQMITDGANLGKYGPARDGIDGVFGSTTERELQRIKGVTAVTLETYDTTPTRAPGANMGGRDQLYTDPVGEIDA